MSAAAELIQRAHSIRQRLMHPPNAVPDRGINLSKPWNGKKGWVTPPPPPTPIYVIPRARVQVLEYHQDPPGPPPIFSAEDILKFVARYTFTSVEALKSKARHGPIVFSRMTAIYLLGRFSRSTGSCAIGRILNRDHTSILHAQQKLAKEFKSNSPVAATVRGFEAALLAISRADHPGPSLATLTQPALAVSQGTGLPQQEIPPMDQGIRVAFPDAEAAPWPSHRGAVYRQADPESADQ